MVNIECTRCHATGTDYPTIYVAKFSLKHETGCGAKIGIPKYSEGKTQEQTTVISETKVSEKKKTKKKKTQKKIDTIITS